MDVQSELIKVKKVVKRSVMVEAGHSLNRLWSKTETTNILASVIFCGPTGTTGDVANTM